MPEHQISEEEVDAFLKEIDKKYRQCSESKADDLPKTKNSLPHLITKLYEEFDCLGIAKSKVSPKTNDVMQLVIDVFKLVNIHRKAVVQLKDNNFALTKLKADNLRLEKKIDTCKDDLLKKDDAVKVVNQKLVLLRMECDDLKKQKLQLLQELECFKKIAASKRNEFEHRLNQLHFQNLHWKDIIEKNAGHFKSKDDIVIETLRKYKLNEEVYKDTIRKLQDNNQGLIGEILNLKEEVLMAIYDKNKQSIT